MRKRNNNIIEKVKKSIEEHGLISFRDSILVGLSGGADSVCLTHILYTLGKEMDLNIAAAHLNHNIRGAEAQRDEDFARAFSESLGIPCFIKTADVIGYAKTNGMSVEMAGREKRYAFFGNMATEHGFDKIATAHNRNDNAETILMNFMRGSSLAGLSGIPYIRGNVIRPVLDLTRAEIEEYCRNHNLEYITDSTNSENEYTRNKIRHFIIPNIEEQFNKNFVNTVSRNGEIIKAEDNYINQATDAFFLSAVNGNEMNLTMLCKQHTAIKRRAIKRFIAQSVGRNDISSDFIEDALSMISKGRSGKEVSLPNGYAARLEYDRLVAVKQENIKDYEYKAEIGKKIKIPEYGVEILIERAKGKQKDDARYFSNVNESDIVIRNRRFGDVFYPCGMDGRKKLKKFFADEKIPVSERNKIPIITFGGEIGYIVGLRSDKRFKYCGNGIKITIFKIA